jgi:YwiC-like protein
MSAPAARVEAVGVSLRSIALPVEHGGWGLLAEPLLVGLALSPTPAGLGFTLAALGAFLARHPLKLVLADRQRGARYPRTAIAERIAAVYGVVALTGALVACASAPWSVWWPVLAAAPLGAAQLWFDSRHQGRRLVPELLGGTALGSTAAAISLSGGWPAPVAGTVWALMAFKAVTSVLYVRARLRLDRGQPAGVEAAMAAQTVALLGSVALATLGTAPLLAVLAFAVLLVRAARGLSPGRRALRTRDLGFRELAYGLLTAALVAAGYLARW